MQTEKRMKEARVVAEPHPQMHPEIQPQEPFDLASDFKAHIAASGRDEEEIRLAVIGLMRRAEQDAGLNLGALDSRVPFKTAVSTLLPLADPEGRVTEQMRQYLKSSREVEQAAQPGQEAENDEPDIRVYEIRQKQQLRRELLARVGSDGNGHTWLSAIAFVLMSALLGFENTLRIWGRASASGSLKPQLDTLNREIQEDIELYKQDKYERRLRRSEAARLAQRQADREYDFQTDIYKMLANHRLALQRAQARGIDQGITKKMADEFSRNAVMADDARAEIADQQEIIESPNSSDAARRNAERIKEHMRIKLEGYKARMNEINEELRGPVGVEEK